LSEADTGLSQWVLNDERSSRVCLPCSRYLPFLSPSISRISWTVTHSFTPDLFGNRLISCQFECLFVSLRDQNTPDLSILTKMPYQCKSSQAPFTDLRLVTFTCIKFLCTSNEATFFIHGQNDPTQACKDDLRRILSVRQKATQCSTISIKLSLSS